LPTAATSTRSRHVGKRLIGVKPGIVLISDTTIRSPATRKSIRANPSAPMARYTSRASLWRVARWTSVTSARVEVSDRPGVYFAA
jgi:hypothetical protein